MNGNHLIGDSEGVQAILEWGYKKGHEAAESEKKDAQNRHRFSGG